MTQEILTIEVIPHSMQRYPTTGDWRFLEPVAGSQGLSPLKVRVSDMGNDDYHFLIGFHEALEAKFCQKAGIDEADVTLYDELYESARPLTPMEANQECFSLRLSAQEQLRKRFSCRCQITDTSEPGDDIHAPYYQQHQLATSVERMAAVMLGVSWNDYEAANLKLYEEKP